MLSIPHIYGTDKTPVRAKKVPEPKNILVVPAEVDPVVEFVPYLLKVLSITCARAPTSCIIPSLRSTSCIPPALRSRRALVEEGCRRLG